MADIELFVIVKRDGSIRKRGRSVAQVYTVLGTAKNKCLDNGDSVVRATLSLDGEPLFVRAKRVTAKQIEAADRCGAAACTGCQECL